MVVSKGGSYTKHIYIGSQRIVSKLGDLDSYGQDPRRIEYAGANVDGASVNYKGKYTASQQAIRNNYAVFEVPYYGTDNDNYVDGKGFCCNDASQLRSGAIGNGNDNPELFQYYYHSDHLGSSSLITNLDGDVVQHVEYVPFGEVFIEERNNTWNTPYLFNAKELDEETGLYYYGARYYDPKTSIWLSVDPMQEKYPNISTYLYCANNPVNRIDPDGRDDYKLNRNGEIEFVRQTKAETHTIYAVNNKGKIDKKNSYEVGKYVLDTKETVSGVKAQDSGGNVFTVTLDIYTSIGDEKSTGLFEFVSKNSGNVEWSQVKTTNGGTDVNYLVTSREEGIDAGITFMTSRISSRNNQSSMADFLMGSPGVNIREANHSHPNGSPTVSVGDINVADKLQSVFPNAQMNIFTPYNGAYIPFNRYSPTGVYPEIEIIVKVPKKINHE